VRLLMAEGRGRVKRKLPGAGLQKMEWNMNRHRDGFQGVRCRVVTSCGSGSGTGVQILEDEEARR
jgi:hypothetical protein